VSRKIVAYFFTIIALVISGGIVSQAQAQSQVLQTRHVRDAVQNGQAKFAGPLSAADTMRIVLVLPLRDPAGLDNFLKDLYDPSSASYRQFLTVEEFTEKFGPTQADYDTVIHFAEANGLKVVATSRNRLNLDVTGSVASIDKALNVKMGVYQHPTESRTFFSPDREPTPALPFQLWHIAGLDNYSIPHPAGLHKGVKSNATTGSGPSASFLGSDMRAAYYGGSLTGSGQSLGLLEYYGTDLADLTTYFKNAGQTNAVTVTLKSTDGTSTSCLDSQGCDDTEQTLDMTQAIGMAPGMSSLVMYVGSVDSAIFNAMATASPLNAQLSSSWTWSPADPSTDNPYFTEFAAQGQNLFQAAGDSGAWKSSSAIWPADSVYVTTVGGTDLDTSSAAGPWSSESAWVDGGGGISPNKQAIPSWQTAAAAGCSACSKTYRNAPDVSANANFTFYVCADQTTCTANDYGGTSFAAPMWAGYLALTNEQSLLNGNKVLGFINPALYAIGAGSSYHSDFHDITSGSNGDSATAGYDLATGWGSPNGAALLNALAGGTSSTPTFTLSANPGSVSITQGAAGGTSTITVNDVDGFSGSVTLSASGLPSGVTAAFGTNPTTGTSLLTLTASATAATGTATVTITGVSGSITQTTTVSLTVNAVAAGNYTLSASPTSLTIDRSASGTSTVTITRTGGFTGAVSFTASGLGSGTTATFSPNPSSTGSSVVTFTASSSASTGTRTITITGTSGSLSHTTTISLRVRR
jgi:subtilase family serine protease